jgi:hypothetical protein
MVNKENRQTKNGSHLRATTCLRKMPKNVLTPEIYRGILHANSEDVQKIVEHLENHRLYPR